MKMTRLDLLWFTFLSIGIPLVLLWGMRRAGKLDWFARVAMILMLLIFVLVDAGLWVRFW